MLPEKNAQRGVKILGIDPGLSVTGWAIIQKTGNNPLLLKSGYISWKKHDSFAFKIKDIYGHLTCIIGNNNVTHAAIENPFLNSNAKTSLILSQFKGAIMLTLALKNIEMIEYQPSQIKKYISGNGKCTKEEICKMLRYTFPKVHSATNHNEVDAIAIALSYYYSLNERIK
ncbi:MAG: crossover junction endodeoxyribonuclease RuvC [Candidatus Xenolissoclinum pacificiensis L6]|uniref:Crossover junction endodeoxyribonuclease RuvC n=1 Tax=Candidatus Xenolissoclinum pacificiensis L6 TaxID=1401685 RepID=W2V1A9_9RICK|nr:MAG: crossover junction endodeoxyribonuclease RuvC [Candidatus Xenolissoclinum pacificiensis L6]